jgi:hypothetical protein
MAASCKNLNLDECDGLKKCLWSKDGKRNRCQLRSDVPKESLDVYDKKKKDRKKKRDKEDENTPLPPPPVGSLLPPKGKFRPPLLSNREMSRVKIPLSEIKTKRFKDILKRCGFVVVTGVLSPADVKRLEGFFGEDIRNLIIKTVGKKVKPDLSNAHCHGMQKNGKPCTISHATRGHAKKHVHPLLAGHPYCALHTPEDHPLSASVVKSLEAPKAASFKVQPDKVPSWILSELGRDPGYCPLRGLPHGKFAWGCRLNKKARSCWEVLHGTKSLVVSLDVPFYSPRDGPTTQANGSWPHADHNKHYRKHLTYQGVLYVWGSEIEEASTTVLWPSSHKREFSSMMLDEKSRRMKSHYVPIKNLTRATRDELFPRWEKEARRVPVPSGALLIWDSRLMHQGWKGGPRLAQPICWEPRDLRDEDALERKRRFSALGLPTNHSAASGLRHQEVSRTPFLPTNVIHDALHTIRPTIKPEPLKGKVSKAWSNTSGDFKGQIDDRFEKNL